MLFTDVVDDLAAQAQMHKDVSSLTGVAQAYIYLHVICRIEHGSPLAASRHQRVGFMNHSRSGRWMRCGVTEPYFDDFGWGKRFGGGGANNYSSCIFWRAIQRIMPYEKSLAYSCPCQPSACAANNTLHLLGPATSPSSFYSYGVHNSSDPWRNPVRLFWLF